MADSLFDNRYRYDYIYPRGRSGETLRAVDSLDHDREVVVKRPAPHDAPPIRSGQEVSIANERKALQRLQGHPALAELRGGGQFLVSGVVHQYIVVERAHGAVVADMVRDLAQRGDRLPMLEMLVIVDALLDLLAAAHARDIVYNDVDAKHLFWDRDTYRLKVIDWGNAVFLEGDEATAQGVSRQSDIFQCGELLYFIVTGGGRVDAPRDAPQDFILSFGDDEGRVPARLQAIISRAAHPNVRFRYRSIAELRKELADFRAPLQREHDLLIERVRERLQTQRSKDELNALIHMLEPALQQDPGNPDARAVFNIIDERLSALEIAGDLDAARIYLESGNWPRSAALLDELRGRTRGETALQVKILREWARMLESAALAPTPLAFMDAITLVFESDYTGAAHVLLTQDAADDQVRGVGWLMTERVAAHVSDVVVLWPNLYRLQVALDEMATEPNATSSIEEARKLLTSIQDELQALLGTTSARKGRKKATATATIHLVALRDQYRAIVDRLATLGTLLEGSPLTETQHRRLPPGLLERCANAVMTLADNMHVIGRQAVSSPSDARAALENSRSIDPDEPSWELIQNLLDRLYELLQSYQTYIPAADGSDLAQWLVSAARDLKPFSERLFDELLVSMIVGLETGAQHWLLYADSAVMGGKATAVSALTALIESITLTSPTLAGWLNQLRSVVQGAGYVERFALHGALGRALADGWENFDRGRLQDAERLATQAFDAARRDVEQMAARRLRELAEVARAWVERSGVNDAQRCDAALQAVDALFAPDERAARQQFTAQMPNPDMYLRAMGKGLVDTFARSSSAALRLLFFSYILEATLAVHGGSMENGTFWREAALRTLPDAHRHPLMRVLDEFTERRRDLLEAGALLNSVDHPGRLREVEGVRRQLEENRQAKLLAPAVYSLREIEAATRDWQDGEFKAAGNKMENAVKAIDDVETAANITLTQYWAWLLTLLHAAAELHALSRKVQSLVEARGEAPDEGLRAALRSMVTTTERMLGPAYAAGLRQWRDTYEQFLAAYTDRSMRRSAKLNRFNDLFRAMFIERQPTYPLFRHWYSLVDAAPEFPAPPSAEPVPQVTEDDDSSRASLSARRDADAPPESAPAPRRSRRFWLVPIVLVGIAIIALLAWAVSGVGGGAVTPEPGALALEASATEDPSSIAVTAVPSATPTMTVAAVLSTLAERPSDTPAPTNTPTSTLRPPTRPPTLTPTATNTPLPAEGVRGVQPLLPLIASLEDGPWTAEAFAVAEDGAAWRLGRGTAPPDSDVIRIVVPAEPLNVAYGNNAVTRIISIEADLQLVTYNPALVLENEVYFGISMSSATDAEQRVSLQINLADVGVVNISQVTDGTPSVVSQRSLGEVRLRLRLDYNPETNLVTAYVNGEPVGLPMTLDSESGVLPGLYVKDGGVIIYVQSWTLALR